MKTGFFYCFLAVFLALSASAGATPSTNFVSVCDEPDLQAAIAAGGWISIGCSSTILLTSTLTITNHVILDGSGVSAVISGGGQVALFHVAPGASLSITNLTLANGASLATNGSTPVAGGAIYNQGGTVALTACILFNNSANSSVDYDGAPALGGAICNAGGTVGIYQSILFSNTAAAGLDDSALTGFAQGGAIYNTNGTVVILNTLLQGNTCTVIDGVPGILGGGAVYQVSGALFVTNSLFSTNQAAGQTDLLGNAPAVSTPVGGALASAGGSVSLDLCQFTGNSSTGGNGTGNSPAEPAFGGAVYSSNLLSAVWCSFSGNQASGGYNSYNYGNAPDAPSAAGGAIFNLGPAVLRNCAIYSNSVVGGNPTTYVGEELTGGSAQGGGVYNGGSLAATNCTIAQNTTYGTGGTFGNNYRGSVYSGDANGGGVYNAAGASLTGVNLTVARNTSSAYADTNANNQNITFVSGSMAGSQTANAGGSLLLLNSILAYGVTSNASGTITDEGDNLCSDGSANFNSSISFNATDPLLASLTNNGGPTLTMALWTGSPAIARANSAGAPPDDQRGYARPNGAGVIDLGAYQYGATQIYVPPPSSPTISLSAALSGTNVLVRFTLSSAITNTVHLQASTNLTVWTDYATYGAVSSTTNITVPFSKQGVARQFFRLWW